MNLQLARIQGFFRKSNRKPTCFICGNSSEFITTEGFTIRESICSRCRGSRRNSDLAKIIIDTFSSNKDISLANAKPYLKNLKIYEAQASGPVHNKLKKLPNYICSEYLDDIPPGHTNKDGILCENLQDLSFPDETFDLIISQDVLEHVECPDKAFSEIFRVLKHGGYHIFTIPYHEGNLTLRRIVIEKGERIDKNHQVYHGDPIRKEGALVFTDFGYDMNKMIESWGFNFEAIPCGLWYSPSEIPYIVDDKEYQKYIEYANGGNMLKYFKYNSWVFRTRKG